jgi:hypothetical protein
MLLRLLRTAGEGTATHKAFKLGKCQPSQTAATVSNLDDLQAGRIEVKIQRVAATGTNNTKHNIKAAGPSSAAANKKLQEGKKVRTTYWAKLVRTAGQRLGTLLWCTYVGCC